VNASAVDKPFAFNVVEKPARIARTPAVIIHNLRGRFSTAVPIFAQVPVNCALTSSLRGIRGQKIQRPKGYEQCRKQGKIVTIAAAIPIAPTGPDPRFPDRSLRSKTKSAAITSGTRSQNWFKHAFVGSLHRLRWMIVVMELFAIAEINNNA
jgi:hypothetical protein